MFTRRVMCSVDEVETCGALSSMCSLEISRQCEVDGATFSVTLFGRVVCAPLAVYVLLGLVLVPRVFLKHAHVSRVLLSTGLVSVCLCFVLPLRGWVCSKSLENTNQLLNVGPLKREGGERATRDGAIVLM